MNWKSTFDAWASEGTLGKYQILLQQKDSDTLEYAVRFCGKGKTWRWLGDFTSLENAKWCADNHDGYRASKRD